jgi:hypothetical protein
MAVDAVPVSVRSPDPETVTVVNTSVAETSVRMIVEAPPLVVILAASIDPVWTVRAEPLVLIF